MNKLVILLLCTLSIYVNAQEKVFTINGEVKGSTPFKYAYAFDIHYELIERTEIIAGKFQIKGTYPTINKFDELPYAIIFMSNKLMSAEEIEAANLLSKRKHYNCRVILQQNIEVIYQSDEKLFTISGGELNKVQSQFEVLNSTYRKRRDSAYASIDKINTDDEAAKLAEAKRLFKENVDSMIKLSLQNTDSEATLFNFDVIIFDQLTSSIEVEKTFNQLSDRLKNSSAGLRLRKLIDDKINTEIILNNPPYTVGMKLPKIELIDHKNKMVNGNTKFGKYTLVDFWATWCVPCRQETPNLILAEKLFKDKGFKIITISIDDTANKDKWLKTIEDDKMLNFTNLFNGNDLSGLSRELKIVAIPANYLVDETGNIVAVNLRGDQLQQKLKELMP